MMRMAVTSVLILGVVLLGVPTESVLAQDMGGGKIPKMQGPKQAKSGAVVLSVVMPGTGEWLNRDFEGPFPMLECIVGALCFPIMCASALDAAAGDESSSVRANFWSKPDPQR
ncbi:hypothetical protein HQ576_04660 [bacterium]|nr:hypothetical protein [bacterium]